MRRCGVTVTVTVFGRAASFSGVAFSFCTVALLGTPLGPPLGRGVSCGAVACQVKGDTVHIEKRFKKYLRNFKKAFADAEVIAVEEEIYCYRHSLLCMLFKAFKRRL